LRICRQKLHYSCLISGCGSALLLIWTAATTELPGPEARANVLSPPQAVTTESYSYDNGVSLIQIDYCGEYVIQHTIEDIGNILGFEAFLNLIYTNGIES
jgi:hypothetical protein